MQAKPTYKFFRNGWGRQVLLGLGTEPGRDAPPPTKRFRSIIDQMIEKFVILLAAADERL